MVDLVFMVLFSALGVLQITGIKELFGMSGGTEPMAKQWYVLRVASNKEDHVRESLEGKVKIEGLDEVIGKILVPTERISRIKGGVKRVAERKLYPGYVFIEMEMEENGSILEQAWFPDQGNQRGGRLHRGRRQAGGHEAQRRGQDAGRGRKGQRATRPPSRSNSPRASRSSSRKARSRGSRARWTRCWPTRA